MIPNLSRLPEAAKPTPVVAASVVYCAEGAVAGTVEATSITIDDPAGAGGNSGEAFSLAVVPEEDGVSVGIDASSKPPEQPATPLGPPRSPWAGLELPPFMLPLREMDGLDRSLNRALRVSPAFGRLRDMGRAAMPKTPVLSNKPRPVRIRT